MKCFRCGFNNQPWVKICSKCKLDLADPESRSRLLEQALQFEGFCGRCRERRRLNTEHQSSADDGWDCPDEFCGQMLTGKTGSRITPDNFRDEAWPVKT